MSDLTPERRAELREYAAGIVGVEQTSMLAHPAEMLALLDACDERDRIKAELGDPSRHYIMDGWLVIDTGRHTCGTGPGGHYGAHEPGCGLEQALRLDNLQGWPGDERDRLAEQVERVRALHVPFRIYDECECEDTTTPGHIDVEEVGITCNLLHIACRECCTSGVDIRYQTEDCANGHDHRDTQCPTIAALDGPGESA